MLLSRRLIIRDLATLFTRQISDRNVAERIRVGDSLPETELYEDYPTNKVYMPYLTKGKNVVIFAVPGAFCPGCSKTHLPGILKHSDKMKEDGVDEIVCLSVNDPYVMAAWGHKHKTRGKVRMLADPSGSFISAMGLGIHLDTLGGFRAKRFSMVVFNNNVMALNVEPDGTGLACSLASQLNYKQYIKTLDFPDHPEHPDNPDHPDKHDEKT